YREVEVLAGFCFALAAVLYQLLDHVEVHKRLAAEKVDLKVVARARVRYQPVQRLDAYLTGQQRALVAVDLAGVSKAVFAPQVAIVRGVRAPRREGTCTLYHLARLDPVAQHP